jgi:hypothetical protein
MWARNAPQMDLEVLIVVEDEVIMIRLVDQVMAVGFHLSEEFAYLVSNVGKI